MKFEDAVRRSIRSFISGKGLEKTAEMKEGGLKYTKEFFDNLEEQLIGKPKKSSKKAEKSEDAENDE